MFLCPQIKIRPNHERKTEMTIDLIFISYNRLEYTKLSLASVLAEPKEEFSLTIWDNGSTDGTVEYLRDEVNDCRIDDIVLSNENLGLKGGVNYLFKKSSADLLGIIPNDFIVTPGWTRTLAQAHIDIPEFGMIGCWHFFPEDFDFERAKHKIRRFGGHQILQHPWTGGGAGLVKLEAVKNCGLLKSNSTTDYWIKMALKGYINGFYYPLIYVEHLDDPRSKHSRLHRMSFEKAYQYIPAFQRGELGNIEQYIQLHKKILDNLLTGPYDPEHYCGWRAKARRCLDKVKSIKRLL